MDGIIKDELRNKVWSEKYKADSDNSPEGTFKRVAQAVMGIDYLEAYELMKDLKFIPGGRILAGAGVEGNLTLANCYVLPIKDDSVDAIFNCAKEAAETYKQGGGVGIDISCLRPIGAPVNNAARISSGSVSFMEIFDKVTAVIGGKNRRGALMIAEHINHPDILEFIRIKDDDNKNKITNANISVKITDAFMVAVEEDSDWELWYPEKIDYEVKEFVEVENIQFCFDYPNDSYFKIGDEFRKKKVYKVVKAKDIWNEIVKRAWNSGEPGVLFWDTMKEDNSTENDNPLVCTNPCITDQNHILTSEGWQRVIALINKPFKAVVNGKEYHSDGFFCTGEKDVYEVILVNGTTIRCTKDHKFFTSETEKEPVENLVGKEVLCDDGKKREVREIKYKGVRKVYDCTVEEVHRYNCEGVIISNCGEITLPAYGACCLGSINVARFVENSVFDYEEYVRTIHLGVRFLDNVLDVTKHPLTEQTRQMRDYRRLGLGITGLAHCLAYMKLRYDSEEAINFVDKLGAILEAESYKSSFELAKTKGAYPNFVPSHISGHLAKVIEKGILDYDEVIEHGIRNCALLTCAPSGSISIIADCSSGIEPIFQLEYERRSDSLSQASFKVYDRAWREHKEKEGDVKPDYFVTAYEVNPLQKIKLQATLQQYIDNSISVTTNLPKDVKIEEVEKIYYDAWETGCKGCTIFREGSRVGVLSSASSSLVRESHEILEGKTIMLPLHDKVYITVNYHPVTTSAMEVFISSAKSGSDRKAVMEGYGRLISLFLQRGGKLDDVVTTLLDIKGENVEFAQGWTVQSLPDAIAKGLIKCMEGVEVKCPECGGKIIMTSGCMECKQCGFSKCG